MLAIGVCTLSGFCLSLACQQSIWDLQGLQVCILQYLILPTCTDNSIFCHNIANLLVLFGPFVSNFWSQPSVGYKIRAPVLQQLFGLHPHYLYFHHRVDNNGSGWQQWFGFAFNKKKSQTGRVGCPNLLIWLVFFRAKTQFSWRNNCIFKKNPDLSNSYKIVA